MKPYDEELELLDSDDEEDELDAELSSDPQASGSPSHSPVSGLYARSIPLAASRFRSGRRRKASVPSARKRSASTSTAATRR